MKKAYSLIELILVISIILVLVTIGSLSFNIKGTYRAKNDLHKLKKDIEATRNIAIVKKEESNFKILDNSYEIICGDFYKRKDFSKDLEFTNRGNIKNISFTKNGATTFSGSGTVVFKIKNKYYYITVEPVTGKVNLKDEEERILFN